MNVMPTDRSMILGYALLALRSMGYPRDVIEDILQEISASIDVQLPVEAMRAYDAYRAIGREERNQ